MTRLALCVGINDYPGTQNDLRGCVNDALDWRAALEARGFHADAMLDGAATGAAIRGGIGALVGMAKPGDSVVVTYSGHGTWVPDQNGDEADGRDEALCPHDFASAGALVDDELLALFSRARPGVRLVFVADACHSGTVARAADFGDPDHPRVRFLSPALGAGVDVEAARAVEHRRSRGLPRPSALLLAACTDAEYSYDASFGGRPNGAFTRAALDALAGLPPGASYAQWHKAIRTRLPSRTYPQRPQLGATAAQRLWPALG